MGDYTIGAELPDYPLEVRNRDGQLVDFSSGWTFTVKLGLTGQSAVLTKTNGIAGSATSPNIVIGWDAGQFDALPPGAYTLQVAARQTSSGKDRIIQVSFSLDRAVA